MQTFFQSKTLMTLKRTIDSSSQGTRLKSKNGFITTFYTVLQVKTPFTIIMNCPL